MGLKKKFSGNLFKKIILKTGIITDKENASIAVEKNYPTKY